MTARESTNHDTSEREKGVLQLLLRTKPPVRSTHIYITHTTHLYVTMILVSHLGVHRKVHVVVIARRRVRIFSCHMEVLEEARAEAHVETRRLRLAHAVNQQS